MSSLVTPICEAFVTQTDESYRARVSDAIYQLTLVLLRPGFEFGVSSTHTTEASAQCSNRFRLVDLPRQGEFTARRLSAVSVVYSPDELDAWTEEDTCIERVEAKKEDDDDETYVLFSYHPTQCAWQSSEDLGCIRHVNWTQAVCDVFLAQIKLAGTCLASNRLDTCTLAVRGSGRDLILLERDQTLLFAPFVNVSSIITASPQCVISSFPSWHIDGQNLCIDPPTLLAWHDSQVQGMRTMQVIYATCHKQSANERSDPASPFLRFLRSPLFDRASLLPHIDSFLRIRGRHTHELHNKREAAKNHTQ
jgi:hypothetical protein